MITVVEKDYDINKFIKGKETKKINEIIKEVNASNFNEKFKKIDVDEEIIGKIKILLLSKKSEDIIEQKILNQKRFLFAIIKIKIENSEDGFSIVIINGIKITGEFHVIKTYKVITKRPCQSNAEKEEEREGFLTNDEFDKIFKILLEEVNNEFTLLNQPLICEL